MSRFFKKYKKSSIFSDNMYGYFELDSFNKTKGTEVIKDVSVNHFF